MAAYRALMFSFVGQKAEAVPLEAEKLKRGERVL